MVILSCVIDHDKFLRAAMTSFTGVQSYLHKFTIKLKHIRMNIISISNGIFYTLFDLFLTVLIHIGRMD